MKIQLKVQEKKTNKKKTKEEKQDGSWKEKPKFKELR
jgi:hypothetical protein